MKANLQKSLDIGLLFGQYLHCIRKGFSHVRTGHCVQVTFPQASIAGIEGFLKKHEDLTDELQVFLGELATLVYQKELELRELMGGMSADFTIFGEDGIEKSIEFIGENQYPDEEGEVLDDDWDESEEDWERGNN